MNGRLRQWWRYPYGVAGPVAVAYLAVGAVVGTVSAVEHMPLLWQLLPGFAVLYLGERVARSATRLYARKRDIPRPPKPSQVRQEASKLIGAWPGLVAVAPPLLLGWQWGWGWPIAAGGVLANQILVRWRWAKRYPGDPRWARDWSQESSPAYEFRALSEFSRGRYEEAQELLRMALENDPRNGTVLYNLACAEAHTGKSDAALQHLTEAVAAEERFRKQAQNDPDLTAVRDDPRFPR